MKKFFVAIVAAFLGATMAHAAGARHASTAAPSKHAHRVRHASDATVMSLSRLKPCAPGLVKRARGCVSSALAMGSDANDTSVMGDIGERRQERLVVRRKRLHPR
jgi:hypothetical protein